METREAAVLSGLPELSTHSLQPTSELLREAFRGTSFCPRVSQDLEEGLRQTRRKRERVRDIRSARGAARTGMGGAGSLQQGESGSLCMAGGTT